VIKRERVVIVRRRERGKGEVVLLSANNCRFKVSLSVIMTV
jgi:hypothetical protein